MRGWDQTTGTARVYCEKRLITLGIKLLSRGKASLVGHGKRDAYYYTVEVPISDHPQISPQILDCSTTESILYDLRMLRFLTIKRYLALKAYQR